MAKATKAKETKTETKAKETKTKIRTKKHTYNHAKLRILLAINHLETNREEATAKKIQTLLPDMTSKSIRPLLLHYYIRGYVKRALVPKKKTTTKKTMWGWSTRGTLKYKLSDKGRKCMANLVVRHKKGLELNLHRRNPAPSNYFKYWSKADIETAGIPEDELLKAAEREPVPEPGDEIYTEYVAPDGGP